MRSLHEAIAQATVTSDEAEGRVYGALTGVVTDIDAKSTAAKVRIGKQGDNESSHWMPQVGMGGMESVPEVGDTVGIVFQDGDPHRGFYFYFPQSNTSGRPTESMVLGSTLVAMYNDLATKLNNLLSHYQAFYAFVQGHVHASFGTPSASLLAATIDPTAKDTSTSTGLGQASDGSVVASKSGNQKVLSKRAKLR